MLDLPACYSFLTIYQKGNNIHVEYAGNMGARLGHVRHCFDKLCGDGKFDKLLKLGRPLGTPDYLWQIVVHELDFKRLRV